MVRRALIGLVCLCSFSAAAITPEELKQLLAEKHQERLERQRRANTGAVGDLVPVKRPKSDKYSTTEPQSTPTRPAKKLKPSKRTDTKKLAPVPPRTPVRRAAIAPLPLVVPALAVPAETPPPVPNTSAVLRAPPSIVPPVVPPDTSHLYTPPARSAPVPANQSIVSDSVHSSIAFGVRLGTWLDASLDRNTTSGESGDVELTLTADAIGDRRTVPAGTLLFASKSLNTATKRMEMLVTHGITPTGVEFEMRGLVFDPQKTPGLAGVYVLDKKAVARAGATKGAIAAVSAAASLVTGGSVGGAATDAATRSVLRDAGQTSDLNNAHQAIIYVSPQALIIRVEKQF